MVPKSPNLKITPAPFQPSKLSIPPSPFSPLSPLTPPPRVSQQPYEHLQRKAIGDQSPPPNPLRWLWKCHMCNQNYPLGVTRRCLEDGHFFCSGTTTVKTRRSTGKRYKRHKACSSEFDYAGWKKWSNWRREQTGYTVTYNICSAPDSPVSMTSLRATRPKKDCFHRCDYPSECRWGPESTIASKASSPVTTTVTTDRASTSQSPPTTFDHILGFTGLTQTGAASTVEPSPKPRSAGSRVSMGVEFWNSLVAATRVRRTSDTDTRSASPLGLNPIMEEEDGSFSTPTPSSIDEENEEFYDTMDTDTVAEPSIPLRRFSRFEEAVDFEDEDVDEEVAAMTRYEDVDLNIDPRLRP
ncbi:MAG: hypothetical protein M1820_003938 [Bogoriella megaspora]|nr:MAG: hypothetical protein M1820_003938 [Bogoriella megaspora]